MKEALRWFTGKQILSYLREGDYAHPGEEQAIEITLSKFPKNSKRLILDVGCGLGGTAKYVSDNGWGIVDGVDIELSATKFAQNKYSGLHFFQLDICQAEPPKKVVNYNMFYLFNSFYSFHDQKQALSNIHMLGHDSADLVIFDYSDLSNRNTPLINNTEIGSIFTPIVPSTIKELLESSKWQLIDFFDISHHYKNWYSALIDKILLKKHDLIERFGNEAFENVQSRYESLLNSILAKSLGGCIIYASKR